MNSLKKDAFTRIDLKKDKLGCKVYRLCNLCAECFHPESRFDRYCQDCKKEDDLFRYGDWLPEVDDQIASNFF